MIEDFKFDDISGRLLTLSVFEGLLTFGLFSGKFISYSNDFTFKSGRNSNVESLNLLRSIKSLNHLVFPPHLFDAQSLKVKCTTESVYQQIMSKFGSDAKAGLDALSLILDIKNPAFNRKHKARMLWEAYFDEIPSEDFLNNGSYRWRSSSLNTQERITYLLRKISVEEAVAKVFDPEKFDCPAWNKRYLRAFEQWITVNPTEDYKLLLIEAAIDMDIAHIRYHSGPDSFFSHGKKYVLIGENRNVQIEKRPRKVFDGIVVMEKHSEPPKKKRLRDYTSKKVRFSDEEIIDLLRGINFIGVSKWAQILDCPELKFEKRRTNVDLKDKARNLEKTIQQVFIDDKSFWVYPGYHDQCLKPITVFASDTKKREERESTRVRHGSCHLSRAVPSRRNHFPGEINVFRVRNRLQRIQSRIKR